MSADSRPQEAQFDLLTDNQGRQTLAVRGDWTAFTIGAVDKRLLRMKGEPEFLDVSDLGELDTAGAFLLERSISDDLWDNRNAEPLVGEHNNAQELIEVVRLAEKRLLMHQEVHINAWIAMLSRMGKAAFSLWNEAVGILSFNGHAFLTIFRLLLQPHKIRWTTVVAVMEDAGLDAMPIVGMLSFFIGLVVAFLGVNLLSQFGAQVFTVEMVGVLMLREMGVLLTAILLAGRTDSAFTAQIGAMKMREEINAMRVLGLDPMEVLVVPRILALVVMTPFLSFFAMLTGIFGGMLVMWSSLDISPAMYLQRIQDTVPVQHFWAGIVKAPVFALVVGLVGCRQGLLVDGDVQSLGHRTTTSVVQSIFLVILLDAFFALLFLELGV